MTETDSEIAVLKERANELARRLGLCESKIELLTAFQNKALGWMMAASLAASFLSTALQMFIK